MNTLLFLAHTSSALSLPSGLVGLLIWVAVLAVVVWAIISLVRWSGLAIPPPVWIVLTALVCIFLILLIARLFGFVV